MTARQATARQRPSRQGPIGVALGVEGLTAAWPDGRVERFAFPAGLDRAAPREALAQAFSGLAERAKEHDATKVALAVVPPLVEGRVLELPPVSAEEAEAIVRRNPAAHFLGGGEPVLVGVEAVTTGASEPGLFGAALPRSLADAVHGAAAGAGLQIDRLVPAHSAWLAALRNPDAPGRDALGVEALVAVVGDTTHVVRRDPAGPVHHRRIPGATSAALADVLGSNPGRVAVCGPAGVREGVVSGLTAAGFDAVDAGRRADDIAAENASAAEIEFVPARLAMERRDRSRRTLLRMVAAAVLLVVAAGAVQLWGANRSLERIRRWRADIRDDVAPLLAMSDSIAGLEGWRARIEALERSGSGWAVPLVELSVLLPDDAYLEGLQVVGDTLLVDAVAERAGAVVDALRGASELEALRIEGSIRREVVDGETVHERFRLRAVRGSTPSSEDGASDGGQW